MLGEFSTEGVAGRKHLYGGVIDEGKEGMLISCGKASGSSGKLVGAQERDCGTSG
jgi:hypothetical protein